MTWIMICYEFFIELMGETLKDSHLKDIATNLNLSEEMYITIAHPAQKYHNVFYYW